MIHTIKQTANLLQNISYEFIGETALMLQDVPIQSESISIDVQWDVVESVHHLLGDYKPSEIIRTVTDAVFTVTMDETLIQVRGLFHTTIRTNPYRISVRVDGMEIYCRSLYAYMYVEEYKELIAIFLQEKQAKVTKQNEQAWNQEQYKALISRYGEPKELANKIKQNPKQRISPFGKYMPNLVDKKVIHLLGSNGIKAIAMALMGADVTVVDFSRENEKYAKELAVYADVKINYVVSDVFSTTKQQANVILMELGVLHYFLHLPELFSLVMELLCAGGVLILHEFHPISTKLITSTGKKHKVDGNYFEPSITTNNVAFAKHLQEKDLAQVIQRKWTLGEVVTAIAAVGLVIRVLEEEPNHKVHDIGLPKTYTIVAEKM